MATLASVAISAQCRNALACPIRPIRRLFSALIISRLISRMIFRVRPDKGIPAWKSAETWGFRKVICLIRKGGLAKLTNCNYMTKRFAHMRFALFSFANMLIPFGRMRQRLTLFRPCSTLNGTINRLLCFTEVNIKQTQASCAYFIHTRTLSCRQGQMSLGETKNFGSTYMGAISLTLARAPNIKLLSALRTGFDNTISHPCNYSIGALQ